MNKNYTFGNLYGLFRVFKHLAIFSLALLLAVFLVNLYYSPILFRIFLVLIAYISNSIITITVGLAVVLYYGKLKRMKWNNKFGVMRVGGHIHEQRKTIWNITRNISYCFAGREPNPSYVGKTIYFSRKWASRIFLLRKICFGLHIPFYSTHNQRSSGSWCDKKT